MPKNVPMAVESILSTGVDLEKFGSANWSLHRADALEALSKLHDLEIPVLGGDVWKVKDGRPFVTHDNWYCLRSENEPLRSFLDRSVHHAKSYVMLAAMVPKDVSIFSKL